MGKEVLLLRLFFQFLVIYKNEVLFLVQFWRLFYIITSIIMTNHHGQPSCGHFSRLIMVHFPLASFPYCPVSGVCGPYLSTRQPISLLVATGKSASLCGMIGGSLRLKTGPFFGVGGLGDAGRPSRSLLS